MAAKGGMWTAPGKWRGKGEGVMNHRQTMAIGERFSNGSWVSH